MTIQENNQDDVEIIDAQTYLASQDILPPSFAEGIAGNLCLWMDAQKIPYERDRVYATCLSFFNDPECDLLIEQMNQAGIDKSIVMLPDFTYRFPDLKLSLEEMIERYKHITSKHEGRLFAWLGVDPRWGDKGVKLFDRETQNGAFCGLKLYPPCGYNPSDEALYPYYDICNERGLPVSVHTGGTAPVFRLDLGYPRLLDKAALDYPGVNFILSHASTCYVDESIMMCNFRPNVYLEVSGFASQPIENLTQMFKYGISHKLIFATDWPSFRAQGTQQSFVEQMYCENGPVDHMRRFEVERFFSGTIKSLLPEMAYR